MPEDAARSPRLTPPIFQILLALSGGPLHGLGIADEVEAFTDGAVVLPPGTLYRSLKVMSHAGLIREIRAKDPGADPRRRVYGLTGAGRAALEVDALHYDRLARLARKRGILPAPAHS